MQFSASNRMSFTITGLEQARVIEIALFTVPTRMVYDEVVSQVDALLRRFERGNVLIQLPDKPVWTAFPVCRKLIATVKERQDIDRIAFVGDWRFANAIESLRGAITHIAIESFEPDEQQAASVWVGA